MSCAARKSDDPGLRAYQSRRAMYRAARLPVSDDVEPPDRRFDAARQRLGPEHPAVVAAVAARNALAATAEDVALAVAAGFARSLPTLQRAEAEQEARLGALRAAELFRPGEGARFATYARSWIRKFVSGLADKSRTVSIPERARLRGERIDMIELDAEAVAHLDVDAPDVEVIGRVLKRLPEAERVALEQAFGLGARRRGTPNADTVERALNQLRTELDESTSRCRACGCPVPAGRRRYCRPACAVVGQRCRARARNRNYAKSLKGRRANARRQARHRERRAQKVTDAPSSAPNLTR